MAWFDEFFDEGYYRRELRVRSGALARREAEFIERMLAPRPGAALLDLGCGAGRHALALSGLGYRVLGLELKTEFITKAQSSARRRKAGTWWVRADMRRLPLTKGAVDGAYCVFSSFGYFSDAENAGVAAELFRVLKPGARALVEVHNRDRCVLTALEAGTHEWRRKAGAELYRGEFEFDAITSRGGEIVVRDAPVPGGPWKSSVRLYSIHELLRVFEDAGFDALSLFAGLTEEPFYPLCHRMAILVQRPEKSG